MLHLLFFLWFMRLQIFYLKNSPFCPIFVFIFVVLPSIQPNWDFLHTKSKPYLEADIMIKTNLIMKNTRKLGLGLGLFYFILNLPPLTRDVIHGQKKISRKFQMSNLLESYPILIQCCISYRKHIYNTVFKLVKLPSRQLHVQS